MCGGLRIAWYDRQPGARPVLHLTEYLTVAMTGGAAPTSATRWRRAARRVAPTRAARTAWDPQQTTTAGGRRPGVSVPVSQFGPISVRMRTMPPLPAVTDVMKCQLLWSDSADNDVRTTLYFRYSGGAPDPPHANPPAAGISSLAAAMDGQWSATTQLTGVEVTDLSSSSGAQGLHAQSQAGTRAGTDLA